MKSISQECKLNGPIDSGEMVLDTCLVLRGLRSHMALFSPTVLGKMKQNVRPCVSDMAALAPLETGLLVGESAAPPVLLFGLRCRDQPSAARMLWCKQPLAGAAPAEAAEEEGRRHHGGDPLQEVFAQGKYSVQVQPLRSCGRGSCWGTWWGRDAPHQAGSVARARGSTAALWYPAR